MKIAVPTAGDMLTLHFGHCEKFTLLECEDGQVTRVYTEVPPPHEPGVLPRWLAEQGATLIIAGGMGQRAQQLFTHNGIDVVVGAPQKDPAELAQLYLKGELVSGTNACDH
ncbi:MAG: NifB/NifX family molybdenum-iron cluster-binding protein [Fibrobacterota bacterium]